jgi:hypothetical protein
MKKEFKPKNGWRTSLIFARRKSQSGTENKPFVPPAIPAMVPKEAWESWSLLRRSWFLRSPLSVTFAGAAAQGSPVKAKPKVAKTGKSTPLPHTPVRRSTLIDIVKSKRTSVSG